MSYTDFTIMGRNIVIFSMIMMLGEQLVFDLYYDVMYK